MHLSDNLQICLLALESRYPDHSIDFTPQSMNLPPSIIPRGWRVSEVIELLEAESPQLLQSPAILHIDPDRCMIYLSTDGEGEPTFTVHCQGKLPCGRADVEAWRKHKNQPLVLQ